MENGASRIRVLHAPTLHAVDVRDEAVRLLRSAIEAVQSAETYRAVQVLESERARQWWHDVNACPSVIFSRRSA